VVGWVWEEWEAKGFGSSRRVDLTGQKPTNAAQAWSIFQGDRLGCTWTWTWTT
jgi:hypothetical protein